jgi:hypothetical protein
MEAALTARARKLLTNLNTMVRAGTLLHAPTDALNVDTLGARSLTSRFAHRKLV